jgi:hypothetical protein
MTNSETPRAVPTVEESLAEVVTALQQIDDHLHEVTELLAASLAGAAAQAPDEPFIDESP